MRKSVLLAGNERMKYMIPLMILGVMFFVIGFGIGISGFLTPALKSAFQLTNAQSYLVTASIFSAFVVFGRPAGMIIKKIGYRKSMTTAFIIMAVGMFLFIPSARSINFPLFLVALFTGGIGNTLLQASVNPYVTILGPRESAAMRMSMMGILNKSAWWFAPLFLGIFIDLQNVQLNDIISPFYIVTFILLFLGVFTFFAPLPEVNADGEVDSDQGSASQSITGNEKTSVLQYPHLLLGVMAIFLYIGIETLPMASVIDFARISFGDQPNLESYSKYVSLGMIAGYLFGVITIPKYISQTKVLILFSFIGIGASLLLIFSPVQFAFYALLLVSFANSLMWPAIWPLALADLGRFTKTGASLLVMGIVGGAVIPLLFGFIVDAIREDGIRASASNYQTAYWILVPCYLFILYFALHGHKIRKK